MARRWPAVPADLFARWAACELLTGDDLRREADALRRDLLDGHWQLDRATFDLHFQDTGRWLGDALSSSSCRGAGFGARSRTSLALMAECGAATFRSRGDVQFEGRSLTILWTGDAKRLTALIAGPDYVEHNWMAKLGSDARAPACSCQSA